MWKRFTKEEKKGIIEAITESVIVGKEDIEMNLCYLPAITEAVTAGEEKAESNKTVDCKTGIQPTVKSIQHSNTTAWLRCYVVKIRLRAKKPLDPAYPSDLNTLGDHLRKTRLDRGLTQGDVASILQVNTDTVTTWEMNRHKPTAKFAKSIISFLGYIPFTFKSKSLGKQLYYARLINGKTQRQVANLIGCDASNLRSIELDQRNPLTRTSKKIQVYIDSSLDH